VSLLGKSEMGEEFVRLRVRIMCLGDIFTVELLQRQMMNLSAWESE